MAIYPLRWLFAPVIRPRATDTIDRGDECFAALAQSCGIGKMVLKTGTRAGTAKSRGSWARFRLPSVLRVLFLIVFLVPFLLSRGHKDMLALLDTSGISTAYSFFKVGSNSNTTAPGSSATGFGAPTKNGSAPKVAESALHNHSGSRKNTTLPSTESSNLQSQRAPPEQIQVWKPHTRRCHGVFTVSNSTNGPLPLMLREAAVDYRHTSLRESKFSRQSMPPAVRRRVVVHISAAPDGQIPSGMKPVEPRPRWMKAQDDKDATQPSKVVPKASLADAKGRPVTGWTVDIDYVLTDPSCARICFFIDKNRTICAGQEWQVLATIEAPPEVSDEKKLDEYLKILEFKDVKLNLSLPVHLPNGKMLIFEPSLHFGCISGLTPTTALWPNVLSHVPERSPTCEASRRSVAVSGSPLFGGKREASWLQREAAHFAARSLLGPVRFDTVVIGIQTNHSISEIQEVCKNNAACLQRMHDDNDLLINDIRMELEDELDSIGVAASMRSRIILVPFCRLGSDYRGYEKGSPCRWSAYYGQIVYTQYLYTVFSPYHRWHASFDLDEFLVNQVQFDWAEEHQFSPYRRRPNHPAPNAAATFDRRLRTTETSQTLSTLRFRWLDFSSKRTRDWRGITGDVIEQGGLRLGYDEPKPNRTACLGVDRIAGKVALHCQEGFGISNHDTVIILEDQPLTKRQCMARKLGTFDEEILTYHARYPAPRQGRCYFTPYGGKDKEPSKSAKK